MHANIDQRIAQLGIELPNPAPPAGSYVPFVLVGNLLLVAGQLPMWNGTLKHDGRVGAEITLEDGIAAAACAGSTSWRKCGRPARETSIGCVGSCASPASCRRDRGSPNTRRC